MCAQVPTYLEDGSPSPVAPVAGQDFMLLQVGNVVDVILQNLPANANGGLPSLQLRWSPLSDGIIPCSTPMHANTSHCPAEAKECLLTWLAQWPSVKVLGVRESPPSSISPVQCDMCEYGVQNVMSCTKEQVRAWSSILGAPQ